MTTTISHNPNLIPNQNVATQTTIIVDLPPQSLIQLPPGSLIDAKVIANTPDGRKIVNSIFGRLTIKTNLIMLSILGKKWINLICGEMKSI